MHRAYYKIFMLCALLLPYFLVNIDSHDLYSLILLGLTSVPLKCQPSFLFLSHGRAAKLFS